MSLFGARKTSTFQRAKERAEKQKMEEERKVSSAASNASSSHIGGLLNKITGPLTVSDKDGATISEVAREEK